MKKSELFFSALQVPIDYAMIVFAGITSFLLRNKLESRDFFQVSSSQIVGIRQFLEMLLVAAVFFVVIYAIDGLYNTRATKRTLKEIYMVFRATAIGLMIIIIGLFLYRDWFSWFSSRFVILFGSFLIVLFVSVGRIMAGFFQRYLLATRGIGVHRLLLIGSNDYCEIIKNEVSQNSTLGYKIIGQVGKADLNEIKEIRKRKGIDEIIQCCPSMAKRKLLLLKDYCIRNKIVFKYVPTLIQTSNINLDVFLGEPIIEIKNTPLDGWGKIIKRLFDIVGSIAGIIIFGIPMLIAAFLTWLESGMPVIFRNERVGHKGDFDLYKFRYMKREYCHGKQFSRKHNREALKFLDELIKKQSIKKGPLYKIKNDPRKTRLGAFLEKYSIDEFPQFFNVLLGNMSLVGPRPHQPIEVEKYESYQKRVLTIKPGITGLAQVSGRSDLTFNEEVRLDIYYIENWSLWRDVKIILKTIPALLKKRKN